MIRAPLRFLLTVLALWVGARAAILLPDWSGGMNPLPTATAAPAAPVSHAASHLAASAEAATSPPVLPVAGPESWPEMPARIAGVSVVPASAASAVPVPMPPPGANDGRSSKTTGSQPPALISLPPRPASARSSRWSTSAWLLVRDDGGAPALAPGGTLGGSQAGARLTYALGSGFALSARAYLPLRQTSGAELAAGIDWRPIPSLPVSLLAERRQKLGRDGRDAFALTAYGGTSRALTPRTRLDVYAQAGVVGLQSRDMFVDGAVRLTRRVGPVELGAGAWGAAQPGASRLDAGPSLSWRLPVPAANLRLQADWRFRVMGDAAPRSGPALTLAADF